MKGMSYLLRGLLSLLILMYLSLLFSSTTSSNPLPNYIKNIKPSILGVGTYQSTRRPPSKLLGTGFVVSDGQYAITNFHVIPKKINSEKREKLVIFYTKNNRVAYRPVQLIESDRQHDLALLKISGEKFKPLVIDNDNKTAEGENIFFTGYPIGAVLGLFPVTSKGIVSAISPIGIPVPSSSQLSSKMIRRLQKPYMVYQLDATAYPGNSGSPLFSMVDGEVIGVINKVFIKESKETVIQKPSGITYAIPGKFLKNLLRKNKLAIN